MTAARWWWVVLSANNAWIAPFDTKAQAEEYAAKKQGTYSGCYVKRARY
jgi:hypothetical protein